MHHISATRFDGNRDYAINATHISTKTTTPTLLAWMYFPNRLELSFRTVRAFPKASRIGLDSRTCCSIVPSSVDPVLLPRIARYFMMILHVSVFPAPDSPLTKMDCVHSMPTRRWHGYIMMLYAYHAYDIPRGTNVAAAEWWALSVSFYQVFFSSTGRVYNL